MTTADPYVLGYRRAEPERLQRQAQELAAESLVGERELANLKASLRTHLDAPGTHVVSHLFLQAWGRKPA